jgi:hypothetical protein
MLLLLLQVNVIAAVCDQILTTQLQHMVACYSLLLEEQQPMTLQQLELKGAQALEEITGVKVSKDMISNQCNTDW